MSAITEIYNRAHNILELAAVLPNETSETVRDYYQQKW